MWTIQKLKNSYDEYTAVQAQKKSLTLSHGQKTLLVACVFYLVLLCSCFCLNVNRCTGYLFWGRAQKNYVNIINARKKTARTGNTRTSVSQGARRGVAPRRANRKTESATKEGRCAKIKAQKAIQETDGKRQDERKKRTKKEQGRGRETRRTTKRRGKRKGRKEKNKKKLPGTSSRCGITLPCTMWYWYEIASTSVAWCHPEDIIYR